MRAQLINWLTDDIVPEIRKTRDAEGTLLKFANEHNLSPALLEALGQLANTAKTIAYLEKSANRGGSFPIIDVPALVAKYLEATPVKQAKQGDSCPPAGMEWECDLDETKTLPDCFDFLRTKPKEEKVASAPFLNPRIQREAKEYQLAGEIELIKQAKFECEEDIRIALKGIETTFRQNGDYSFEQFEADTKAVHGDRYANLVEKIASTLLLHKWPVKRSSGPGPERLIKDAHKLVARLDTLDDLTTKAEAANQMLKDATKTLEEMVAAHEKPKTAPEAPAQETPKSKETESPKPNAGAKEQAPKPTKPPGPGGSKPPGGGKQPGSGYMDKVHGAIDSIAKKPFEAFVEKGQEALGGMRNDDQRQVDIGMQDVQQIAMLQNLLTTDEVLSEADPQKVVELFNTIRKTSPSIAGDPNVMRVALRTAIQHDGISPFDIKQFADTELANQKTDINRRAMDSHLYGGKPLQTKTQ